MRLFFVFSWCFLESFDVETTFFIEGTHMECQKAFLPVERVILFLQSGLGQMLGQKQFLFCARNVCRVFKQIWYLPLRNTTILNWNFETLFIVDEVFADSKKADEQMINSKVHKHQNICLLTWLMSSLIDQPVPLTNGGAT